MPLFTESGPFVLFTRVLFNLKKKRTPLSHMRVVIPHSCLSFSLSRAVHLKRILPLTQKHIHTNACHSGSRSRVKWADFCTNHTHRTHTLEHVSCMPAIHSSPKTLTPARNTHEHFLADCWWPWSWVLARLAGKMVFKIHTTRSPGV